MLFISLMQSIPRFSLPSRELSGSLNIELVLAVDAIPVTVKCMVFATAVKTDILLLACHFLKIPKISKQK